MKHELGNKQLRYVYRLLGVVDTGALYRSTVGVSLTADGKFIDITLSQAFNTYGLFVDYGRGRNTDTVSLSVSDASH